MTILKKRKLSFTLLKFILLQVINPYLKVTGLLGEKLMNVSTVLKVFDGELKEVCCILILSICCSYEFVKYLRQYINNSVGSVIEEETERCTSAQSQGEVSGYDTLVQHVAKKTRESKE